MLKNTTFSSHMYFTTFRINSDYCHQKEKSVSVKEVRYGLCEVGS